MKQTFPGLIIDEEGGIEVDDPVPVVESPEEEENVQKTEALKPNKIS